MTSDNPRGEFSSVLQKENAKLTHPQEDLHNMFCHIYYFINKERGKALNDFNITNIVNEIHDDTTYNRFITNFSEEHSCDPEHVSVDVEHMAVLFVKMIGHKLALHFQKQIKTHDATRSKALRAQLKQN